MDRHRTRFLASLSARLDQDRALRESEAETPSTWRRHPEPSDRAREPLPAELSEATGPFTGVPEPDDRTTPSRANAAPRSPDRQGLKVKALRGGESEQTSVAALPWSETGMSQALRDAIASVRRVSRHAMDDMPPSRGDPARHERLPSDDDWADEQASFERAGTEERPSFEAYALREEPPLDDAAAAGRFDDQDLHQEPPFSGHVAKAQQPFDQDVAADEGHPLDRGGADERASLDATALHEALPFRGGADALLPFGDRAPRAASSFDVPAARAPLPFGDGAADEPPLFDGGGHEDWSPGLRQEPRDRPPLWRQVTQRRNLHFTAFAVATVVVLVAGFGLGVLSGARDLNRLVAAFGWTPLADETVAATQTSPAPSSTNPAARPAEPETSPRLSELETVRVAPLPTPPTTGQAPDPTANDMPLPPPPKPALQSSLSGEEPPASDRLAGALDDAVDDAAVALLEADGEGGPFEPILVKTPVSGPRVFIHYTESAPGSPATALHLVRHLKAAGFTVEGRGVEFPIPQHSIRYFFDADRDEAEAVSAQLEGQIPGDAAVPILDFTGYEPKPREGHLEVWLGR